MVIYTHIIAMQLVSSKIKVERVVEFGMGTCSTVYLMNKDMFPDIVSLVSFENNPVWAEETKELIDGDDKRLLTVICPEPDMVKEFIKLDMETPQMVLVDSATCGGRVKILHELCALEKQIPYIVLHDSEYAGYAPGLDVFKHIYTCRHGMPWATIVSNIIDLDKIFSKE